MLSNLCQNYISSPQISTLDRKTHLVSTDRVSEGQGHTVTPARRARSHTESVVMAVSIRRGFGEDVTVRSIRICQKLNPCTYGESILDHCAWWL